MKHYSSGESWQNSDAECPAVAVYDSQKANVQDVKSSGKAVY